jgi:hypothetical protein
MVLELFPWMSQNHEVQRFTAKPYVEEIFYDRFRIYGQFFSKTMFLNLTTRSLFRTWD